MEQLEGCKFLMEPHNKTTKGTHTHTPPYKTSSRIRPSLVPLRDFAHLPLLGRNKSDQGEESGTEPSSCVSCGPSSVEAEGVPVVGEDANSDTFYRIVMLAWHVMNQWLFLLKTLVVEVIFDILLDRAELSWCFVILITRIALRRCSSDSGPLTCRVSEKSQYTSDISRSGRFIFLYILRANGDMLSRTHIPHSCNCFLNI